MKPTRLRWPPCPSSCTRTNHRDLSHVRWAPKRSQACQSAQRDPLTSGWSAGGGTCVGAASHHICDPPPHRHRSACPSHRAPRGARARGAPQRFCLIKHFSGRSLPEGRARAMASITRSSRWCVWCPPTPSRCRSETAKSRRAACVTVPGNSMRMRMWTCAPTRAQRRWLRPWRGSVLRSH